MSYIIAALTILTGLLLAGLKELHSENKQLRQELDDAHTEATEIIRKLFQAADPHVLDSLCEDPCDQHLHCGQPAGHTGPCTLTDNSQGRV